jgi:hypothetical protein
MLIYVYTVDNQDCQGILKVYSVGLAFFREKLISLSPQIKIGFYIRYSSLGLNHA